MTKNKWSFNFFRADQNRKEKSNVSKGIRVNGTGKI